MKKHILISLNIIISIIIGIVFAIEISSSNIWTTPASDGDIITADAWNELVTKASPCESEGQADCWLRIQNSSSGQWTCNGGRDDTNKQCYEATTTLGNTSSQPGTSCLNILNNRSDIDGTDSTDDGVYWIKPGDTAFQVYCDMSTAGGGWIVLQRFDLSNSYDTTKNQFNTDYGLGDLNTGIHSHLLSKFGNQTFDYVRLHQVGDISKHCQAQPVSNMQINALGTQCDNCINNETGNVYGSRNLYDWSVSNIYLYMSNTIDNSVGCTLRHDVGIYGVLGTGGPYNSGILELLVK